ncbi:MAG: hypothetical protein WCW16_04140 [Candidatus Magasanikbacteria bacterium]
MRPYFLKSVAQIKARLSSILRVQRNRYFAGIFFVFCITIGLLFVSPSKAVEGVSWLVEGASWMILGIAQICIALTVFFLRFFITLASYNNYIDTAVVQLGWTMVRDVANMFFVVALLVIAFATILGLEQYEWKKGLAKLIMMALFINFSNLIAQLIIDVAHVFTITFLNAVSATAGGNLINMFQLQNITSMVLSSDTSQLQFGTTPEGASTAVFIGVVVAALFAIMAAVAMGSYVVVMAIRVVVLWALIILSPLAYLLAAMPKGEKYAQQWWSEFSKHVLVAPVMVFFLWLAFATLGSGQILQEIQNNDPAVVRLQQTNEAASISITKVSTWENMANYLIAFFFLMMGIKMTQETGAQGAGLVGGAANFGKKVATIATGYAAGRWLAGKAGKGAVAGLKGAAYYMPGVGGRRIETALKTAKANIKAGWYRKGAGITGKGVMAQSAQAKKAQELEEIETKLKDESLDKGERAKLEERKTQLTEGHALSDKERQEAANEAEKKGIKQGKSEKEIASMKRDAVMEAELDAMGTKGLHEVVGQESSGKKHGVIGWLARRDVSRMKHLKKSEGQAETLEKLAFKHMGSEAGGLIFNKKSAQINAQDRWERGLLKAEERRSKAKDTEFETKGEEAGLHESRIKFMPSGSTDWKNQEKMTMADQIASHDRGAGAAQKRIESVLKTADIKIDVSASIAAKGLDVEQKGVNGLLLSDEQVAMEEKKAKAEEDERIIVKEVNDKYEPQRDGLKKEMRDAVDTDPAVEAAQKALDAYREEGGKRDKYLETEEGKAEQKEREDSIDAKLKANKELAEAIRKDPNTNFSDPALEALGQKLKNAQEARKTALVDGNTKEATKQTDNINKIEEDIKKAKEDRATFEKEEQKEQDRLSSRRAMKTDEEEQLVKDVSTKRKAVMEDEQGKYKLAKAEHDKLGKSMEAEIDDKARAPREVIRTERQKLSDYLNGRDKDKENPDGKKKKWEESPEYVARRKEWARKTADIEAKARSTKGLGGTIAQYQLDTVTARKKATQAQLQQHALGLNSVSELFERMEIEEQFAAAAEKIKEGIKNSHLTEIFKKGTKELEKAAEAIAKGAASVKDAYKNIGAGAQAIKAEVESEYLTSLSQTQRQRTKDEADDQYSLQRFGFGTPSTAFKNLIKKRMDETFTGVEREQAVVMAMGSLSHLMLAQEGGEELDLDHQAQMMANVQYLVKQAWSDDLLAHIVNKVNDKDKFTGKEKQEAEMLGRVFVDKLHWGTRTGEGENQKVVIDKNISDNRRTNDLHRLTAYAGDTDLLQSENAVLHHKKQMEAERGDKVGYMEAVKDLAEKITEARNIAGGADVDVEKLGESLGLKGIATGGEELKAFMKRFASEARGAADAVSEFEKDIRSHSEANELMADYKNLALQVGHLDDGGHTYYDMGDKIARGHLADDAMEFVLSDWRKLNSRERARRLKSHSIGQMDEDSGTIYKDERNIKAIQETMQGLTRLVFSDIDGRTKDHTAGGEAGETFETNDATGAAMIGAQSGTMFQKTFKDAEKARAKLKIFFESLTDDAEKLLLSNFGMTSAQMKAKAETDEIFARRLATLTQVADNYAVDAIGSSDFLAASIGSKSGVEYDLAVQGKFNVDLGDQDLRVEVKNEDKLLDWISMLRTNRTTVDFERQRKAIENKFKLNKRPKPDSKKEDDNEPR